MSARDWRLTRAERRVERAGVGRCPRTTASVQGSNQGDRLELSAFNWIGLSPQRAEFHLENRGVSPESAWVVVQSIGTFATHRAVTVLGCWLPGPLE